MPRKTTVLLLMMFILTGIPLRAQAVATPAALTQQSAEPPTAPFAFDVATIKPSDPNDGYFGGGFIASGYHLTNFPLSAIILQAYFPYFRGNQLIGAPAWAVNESYDIVAHIDEASAASWSKLNSRQHAELGRPMLQKLLAERCKLIVHTVPSKADGYILVVSKRGSHLRPAQPPETIPDAARNADPEGGKVLPATRSNDNTETYFNATIQDLVKRMSGPPRFSFIQDRTNLTGRYNFTIRRREIPQAADGTHISDHEPAELWDISATGLELKRVKLPSENLVIDHIERPSPN